MRYGIVSKGRFFIIAFALFASLVMVASAILGPIVKNAGADDDDKKIVADPSLRFVHRSYHMDPSLPYNGPDSNVAYESGVSGTTDPDRLFTDGVEDTKEIRQVTEKISTPDQAMAFIREKVLYKPYYGLMKGAHETLLQGEGNDADQSALMIAILRSKGIPSRFVTGTLTVPLGMASNWIGSFDDNATLSALRMNGIPASIADGKITMDHVWVEAFSGGAWSSYDPSFVQYDYIKPKPSPEALNLPLEEIAMSYLDNATFETDYYSMAEFDD